MSLLRDPENIYNLKNFELELQNNKKVILGQGSFAKVYKATNKIDKKTYGIKAVS